MPIQVTNILETDSDYDGIRALIDLELRAIHLSNAIIGSRPYAPMIIREVNHRVSDYDDFDTDLDSGDANEAREIVKDICHHLIAAKLILRFPNLRSENVVGSYSRDVERLTNTELREHLLSEVDELYAELSELTDVDEPITPTFRTVFTTGKVNDWRTTYDR